MRWEYRHKRWMRQAGSSGGSCDRRAPPRRDLNDCYGLAKTQSESLDGRACLICVQTINYKASWITPFIFFSSSWFLNTEANTDRKQHTRGYLQMTVTSSQPGTQYLWMSLAGHRLKRWHHTANWACKWPGTRGQDIMWMHLQPFRSRTSNFKAYIQLNTPNGFVQRSLASVSKAPILFMKKNDGVLSIYTDYWALKPVTVKNLFVAFYSF